MKKFTTIASSLLLFAGALISCQKENLVEPQTVAGPTSFTATLEQNTDPQTKVTIDGYTPKFEVGDELTVETLNGAKATFAATEVTESGANFQIKGSWSAEPQAPYYVYYGTVDLSMFQYKYAMVNFKLPNLIQTPISNSISKAVMFGQSNDLSSGVSLINACALLKFEVSEPVRNVKITTGSDRIAGVMSVNFTDNRVTPGTDVAYFQIGLFELPVGTYYIPVSPTQVPLNGLKAGFTTNGTDYIWRSKSGSVTLERNKIYDLGDVKTWEPAPEPEGPTVADFVGTFKGSYSGNYNLNPANVTNLTDQEFILEEISEGNYNVKLTKVGGLPSGAKGTLDITTGLLVFPKDQEIPYPNSYKLDPAMPLGDDLQLQFSDDRNELNMVNTTCLIQAMSYPSFCPQITKIELTRQSGGGEIDEGFKITDLTGNTYTVSCKINDVAYSGELTAETTLVPGANVWLKGIFGAGSEAFATFDTETGYITLGSEGASNRIVLPFTLENYITNSALGDNIFVMSADKKSISIHEDLADTIILVGRESGNYATVTDFTATLKE